MLDDVLHFQENMAFGIIECLVCLCLISAVSLSDESQSCPNRCSCERIPSPATATTRARWLQVQCGVSATSNANHTKQPLTSLRQIHFNNIRNNIIQLNLSSNHITNITSPIQLPNLRKLDLSKNRITFIESGVLNEVPNLRQLDLSNNLLTTLKKDTFDSLSSLKQLDISNNQLICDCDVVHVAESLQNKSVKFLSNPKCEFRKSHKSQYLRKLKAAVAWRHNHDECNIIPTDEPSSNPTAGDIFIHPTEDQIVFEGDSLQLRCLVSGVTADLQNSQIAWSWPHELNQRNDTISVENKYSSHIGAIDSSVRVARLSRNHTGHWTCQLLSHHFNQTKTIMVVVISNATKYCPITVTTNNKGAYTWPKTIVGYVVELACQGNILDNSARAHNTCTKSGQWMNLNTSRCPYISETTRILEQFSKVNLSVTKVNAYESALRLRRNYTTDLSVLRDTMDVVYVARTVHKYVEYIAKERQLASVLGAIVSNLSQAPRDLLQAAQKEDGACTRLVTTVERLVDSGPVQQTYLSAQEFRIKRETFPGMTCGWYSDARGSVRCSTATNSGAAGDNFAIHSHSAATLEASVQLPAAVFHGAVSVGSSSSHRLYVAHFTSNKLFPAGPSSGVLGAKLLYSNSDNATTSPVYVMMRLRAPVSVSVSVPVWWDEAHSIWNPRPCQVSHALHDLLVFRCTQLGYYAVVQQIEPAEEESAEPGARFRLSHPAVYIGAFVLLSCMLTATLTYLLCYRAIQMAKKAKHSLVNSWLAVSALCFMYTFGTYQTEDVHLCQIIGLALHYLSLSVLLWMCVQASDMYKRMRARSHPSGLLTDEDGSVTGEVPVRKPLLGVYLVGWGVALIVCGISGAVNMREYAGRTHCFLESAAALSAVLVPSCALVTYTIVCMMLLRCYLSHRGQVLSTGHGHGQHQQQLSEGAITQATDLELLEQPTTTHSNPVTSPSSSNASTSSTLLQDGEHAPQTQLRAHLISLLLYVLSWMFAALATARPVHERFLFEEDLFNILYALLASAFGIFNLFFYCIARHDVRTQWLMAKCWFKRTQFCCRSRSVSDTNRNLPGPTDTQITSRSSSRSSSQPKSVSRHSKEVNTQQEAGTVCKPSTAAPVDLVVLHRQQYRSNNTVPVYELATLNSAQLFYNPHQSGVARKFFRKQRRHNMIKHNNLGATRRTRDLGNGSGSVHSINTHSNMSDVSSNIFGTSSKVNNTNIHVEQLNKNYTHKNLCPNILSENHYSESEYSNDRLPLDIPVQQLMLARKASSLASRKPKMNTCVENIEVEANEKDMRTVSQQCSLEYSSETLSDRVLDTSVAEESPTLALAPAPVPAPVQLYVNPIEDRRSIRSCMSASDVDRLSSVQCTHGTHSTHTRTRSQTFADVNDRSETAV